MDSVPGCPTECGEAAWLRIKIQALISKEIEAKLPFLLALFPDGVELCWQGRTEDPSTDSAVGVVGISFQGYLSGLLHLQNKLNSSCTHYVHVGIGLLRKEFGYKIDRNTANLIFQEILVVLPITCVQLSSILDWLCCFVVFLLFASSAVFI